MQVALPPASSRPLLAPVGQHRSQRRYEISCFWNYAQSGHTLLARDYEVFHRQGLVGARGNKLKLLVTGFESHFGTGYRYHGKKGFENRRTSGCARFFGVEGGLPPIRFRPPPTIGGEV